MRDQDRFFVRFKDAYPHIVDGDLLLFRRRSIISAFGRGPYSHAAIAGRWSPGQTMCLEVREWYGGRAVPLSSQVEARPGMIDVYRPQLEDYAARVRVMKEMEKETGMQYSYSGVLLVGLMHIIPGLCWVYRNWLTDDVETPAERKLPPFCSWAVSRAYRVGAGADPVPNLADRFTEPDDLSRSKMFSYKFTLKP